MHKKEIDIALQSSNPMDSLKQVALNLSKIGLKKEEVYNIFLEHYTLFQKNGNDNGVDYLGDILDMIAGWYVGQNLDLP
jgi:hypothetical protein